MTDEQLQLILDFYDEETRPTTAEPFFIGPKTYDALGAIVKEVERLRSESTEQRAFADEYRAQLNETVKDLDRLRDFVAVQPCECYDEYGKRFPQPCERCRLLYQWETWDEVDKAALAAGDTND